MSALLDALHT